MMKQEFEERIGESVSGPDYRKIEFVYTWSPAIGDVNGKAQIALLYKEFGMSVINSMEEGAIIAKELYDIQRKMMNQLTMIEERISAIRNGDFSFEKCRKDMEASYELCEEAKTFEKAVKAIANKYGDDATDKARKELGV